MAHFWMAVGNLMFDLNSAHLMAIRGNFCNCYLNKKVPSKAEQYMAIPQNCCASYAIPDIGNLSSKSEHCMDFILP